MLEQHVPCRQCENCLRRRGHHWRLRAQSEWLSANRTWFGTLTLSPDMHYRVLSKCRAEALSNGDDFDTFPTEQQFLGRHRQISKEITRYVKRLRKESAAELRFLCVTEAHKSGLPHYHMLVHERGPQTVLHRTLKDQWTYGFTQWKLVTGKAAAGYVTKYLTKSSLARVRASLDYGSINVLGHRTTVRDLNRPPEDTTPVVPSAGLPRAPATKGDTHETGE